MTSVLVVSLVVISGYASQYRPDVMRRVVYARQHALPGVWVTLPREHPRVDGYIAVLDCEQLGRVWTIRQAGGRWEQHLVADCAGDEPTRSWMRDNYILVEVGHPTAARWGTVGRGARIEILESVVVPWHPSLGPALVLED